MPSNYYELYFPILCQVILAAAVAVGLVGGGLLLGKRVRNAAKDTPYESGMQPVVRHENASASNSSWSRWFSSCSTSKQSSCIRGRSFIVNWRISRGCFPFIEMLLFIVLVLAGFFYIWKKGVLDWSHEAMEPSGKTTGSRWRSSGRGYTLTEDDAGAVDRKVILDK